MCIFTKADYILINLDKIYFFSILGVPPSSAMDWYNSLISSDLDLSHLAFSVLALGDSNYPHFCRVGRNVHQR